MSLINHWIPSLTSIMVFLLLLVFVSELKAKKSSKNRVVVVADSYRANAVGMPFYMDIRPDPIIWVDETHSNNISINVLPLFFSDYQFNYIYNRDLYSKKYKYRTRTTNWTILQWY